MVLTSSLPLLFPPQPLELTSQLKESMPPEWVMDVSANKHHPPPRVVLTLDEIFTPSLKQKQQQQQVCTSKQWN